MKTFLSVLAASVFISTAAIAQVPCAGSTLAVDRSGTYPQAILGEYTAVYNTDTSTITFSRGGAAVLQIGGVVADSVNPAIITSTLTSMTQLCLMNPRELQRFAQISQVVGLLPAQLESIINSQAAFAVLLPFQAFAILLSAIMADAVWGQNSLPPLDGLFGQ